MDGRNVCFTLYFGAGEIAIALSGCVLGGVGVAGSSHSCGQEWSLNEAPPPGKLPSPRPCQKGAGPVLVPTPSMSQERLILGVPG